MASQISPEAVASSRRCRYVRSSSSVRTRTASIVPRRSVGSSETASARAITPASPSPKLSTPLATYAAYSPRLWPMTIAGGAAMVSSRRYWATLAVKIAHCMAVGCDSIAAVAPRSV